MPRWPSAPASRSESSPTPSNPSRRSRRSTSPRSRHCTATGNVGGGETRDLRGPAIRTEAVRLLLADPAVPEALHYRDWFQRLLDTGFTVAGKDARHQAAPQLLPTVTAVGGGASHPARSYGASWRSAESDESEQSPGARRASLPAAAFGVCGRLRPLASHARSGRGAGVRRRADRLLPRGVDRDWICALPREWTGCAQSPGIDATAPSTVSRPIGEIGPRESNWTPDSHYAGSAKNAICRTF